MLVCCLITEFYWLAHQRALWSWLGKEIQQYIIFEKWYIWSKRCGHSHTSVSLSKGSTCFCRILGQAENLTWRVNYNSAFINPVYKHDTSHTNYYIYKLNNNFISACIKSLILSYRKCAMEWEEPHDSALYCIQTDGNHMIASGSSYYGVVRLWDKRQTECLQVRTGTGQEHSVWHPWKNTKRFICYSNQQSLKKSDFFVQ